MLDLFYVNAVTDFLIENVQNNWYIILDINFIKKNLRCNF